MGSTPEACISYSWRSFLQARWVIQKGSYWTVGNGNLINIWEDRWLPDQNGFKVFSKKPNNCDIQKVSDLIDYTTLSWNTPLIHKLFLPFETYQIHQIPFETVIISFGLILIMVPTLLNLDTIL